MVPTDDPLKCPFADEWDKKTLSDAIDNLLWTHGMLLIFFQSCCALKVSKCLI